MLEHGGRLRAAADEYCIDEADWLDLSTGVNPHGYPVPELPASVWARLPEPDDELYPAARSYYEANSLLAVPGIQAAIQLLPKLRPHSRVGILSPTYDEHAHAWRRHGHEVLELTATEVEAALPQLDVLVVVSPNNPTGEPRPREQLAEWHWALAGRGGWLVLDEAFIDCRPEESLTAACPRAGLIVLRTLGKFFGLAGIRVGFVFAEEDLLESLEAECGPWPLSGPARLVACRALADHDWQAAMRIRLPQESARLARLLQAHGLPPAGGTELFQWVPTEIAEELYEHLAWRGILVRRFADPSALRFGLPADEEGWRRLEEGLRSFASEAASSLG